MASQNWIRSDNFIDNSTNDNYKLANEIFNEFDSRLMNSKEDIDILEYYNFFNPFNEAYERSYSLVSNLTSSSPGNTLAVKQLIERLRGIEIQKWDIAIQTIYTRESSNYKSILPHFRHPFQNGSIIKRVDSLKNLIIALEGDAKLSDIRLEVEEFYSLLNIAIQKQELQFLEIDTAVNDLEKKRLEASEAVMYVYGKLISKYYKNLRLIDAYFPIDLLQKVMQDLFMATLKNEKEKYLFKRTLDTDTDVLQIKITGENNVIGYFTNGLTEQLEKDGLFVSFPPNTINKYPLSEMGYSSERHHFYIVQKGRGTSIVTIKICS